jgi:hypothetical protein
MTRYGTVVLALVLAAGALSGTGFVRPQQMNMQANPRIINGADTPEQIPDTIAYFHVMYLIGQFAQHPTNPLPNGVLQKLGFTTDEIPQAKRILINFAYQYDANEAEFNRLAAANDSKGVRTDKSPFDSKTAKLVADTRSELASVLGTNSLLNFHSFILSEKRHMRIGVPQ